MPPNWIVFNCRDCDSTTKDDFNSFLGIVNNDYKYIGIQNDSKGLIWFYNYKELINYNGTNLVKIAIPQGFIDSNLNFDFYFYNEFCIDRNNSIWFPAPNSCITKYDGNIFYKFDPQNILSGIQDRICSIYEDNNKLMWFGTIKGNILSFDGTNWKLNNIIKGDDRIPGIIRILGNSKGDIYFLRVYDILKYDGKKFSQINPSNYPKLNIMCGFNSFYIDKSDIIWVGTTYYGLGKYDNFSWQWYSAQQTTENSIRDISQDLDGKIWIISSDTVLSFDGLNFKGYNIPKEYGYRYALYKIFIDMNGDKWFLKGSGTVYKYSGK